MAVPKISHQSKITEIDSATKLIIKAFEETDLSSDTNLSTLFGSIKSASTELTTAIHRNKRESILDEKDAIRDEALRAPFYLVQGYQHHPDEVIKSAAGKVMTVLNNYGMGIANESYAVESSLIESLLEDLKSGPIADAITLLPGLDTLIAVLTTTQGDFENERLAYEKEKAEETTAQSATAVKRIVLDEINGKLITYLNAMMLVNEPTYGSFIRTMSEIIGGNNSSVKKRRAN